MMLRIGLIAACVVLCCQPGRADVVVMDQINAPATLLPADSNNFPSLSQVFEPANAAFNSAVVDDFTLSSATHLTSVQAAMLAFNPGLVSSFASVTSWEIAIYSSQAAAATNIIGNIADVSVAPANVTVVAGIVPQDVGSALITIPVSIALGPGTYQIAVIAHLPSSVGEIGVYASTGGSPGGNNSAEANPGGGQNLPGNIMALGVDAAYRITAASVPEPSSAVLISIGLGLGLVALRRSRRGARTI
jgi:hypothetical protein